MIEDVSERRSVYYVLEGHESRSAGDLLEWGRWFETADRHVASTDIGESHISTVFLGIDHAFGGGGPTILFETMVFGGPLADEQERCSTWEQAEAMHAAMVERVFAAQDALAKGPL